MNLNKEQIDAVNCCDGALLIQAGAGVGKTRVLAQKIMKLVNVKGVCPSSILSFSFTSKAAKELSDRVMFTHSEKQSTITTFHAFCLRVIFNNLKFFPFKRVKVLVDYKQASVLETIYSQSGISSYMISCDQLALFIATFKYNLISVDQAKKAIQNDLESCIVSAYEAYESYKLEHGFIDYEDMITFVVDLFEKKPTVLKQYQSQFRYVFVDEYQDTNFSQNKLYLLLSQKAIHQVVVGDFDQMIYAWRGANQQCMQEFSDFFAPVKEVILEQNYRNSYCILSLANQLISQSTNRYSKKLYSNSKEEGAIELFVCKDDKDEVEFVIEKIKQIRLQHSVQLKDIAILVRTHQHTQKLRSQLLKHQLISSINEKSFSMIADFVFLQAVISYLVDSLDSSAIESMVSFLEFKKVSDLKVSVESLSEEYPNSFAFLKALSQFKSSTITNGMVDIQNDLISFLTPYFSSTFNLIKSHVLSLFPNSLYSLTDIQFKLSSVLSERIEDVDSVQLITAHHSKGKEFTMVFLLGLEEGNFPYTFGVNTDFEEERRLMYVAMTRAKEFLYLGYVRKRYHYGFLTSMELSSFLIDLNLSSFQLTFSEQADYFEDSYLKKLKNRYPNYTVLNTTQVVSAEAHSFKINEGDKVIHQTLGEALVLKKDGSGANEVVHLQFDSGVKQLNVNYAPLFPKEV